MPSLSQSQHKSADRQTIKSGRGWILAVGIINMIVGIGMAVLAKSGESEETDELFFGGIAMFIIGAVFMGCWAWAKRHPFPAAVTALLLYIALQIAAIAVDPTEAVRGIIFKILFLVGLSSAVKSAYRLKKSEQ